MLKMAEKGQRTGILDLDRVVTRRQRRRHLEREVGQLDDDIRDRLGRGW